MAFFRALFPGGGTKLDQRDAPVSWAPTLWMAFSLALRAPGESRTKGVHMASAAQLDV